MPDENGTEASHSDGPSAYDVLFGDTVEESAAAVAEDADAKEPDVNGTYGEAEQDRQEPEAVEDKADAAETDAQAELKVVLSIKGGRATIGVQRPSSDPHIEPFDDPDLSGLAQEIPAVVERAKGRWEDAPKHPAHVKPAPPAKRLSRRQQGSAAQAPAAEEMEQPQPEAPRLF